MEKGRVKSYELSKCDALKSDSYSGAQESVPYPNQGTLHPSGFLKDKEEMNFW